MPSATTNMYMIRGSMNIRPECPAASWKINVAAPSVAAKPRLTDTIRYRGATTLRSSSPRMSMISSAATGKTTE